MPGVRARRCMWPCSLPVRYQTSTRCSRHSSSHRPDTWLPALVAFMPPALPPGRRWSCQSPCTAASGPPAGQHHALHTAVRHVHCEPKLRWHPQKAQQALHAPPRQHTAAHGCARRCLPAPLPPPAAAGWGPQAARGRRWDRYRGLHGAGVGAGAVRQQVGTGALVVASSSGTSAACKAAHATARAAVPSPSHCVRP